MSYFMLVHITLICRVLTSKNRSSSCPSVAKATTTFAGELCSLSAISCISATVGDLGIVA